jgi:hypothetical protein
MSRNVVRISQGRPDGEGYFSLEHTGTIYDGTSDALARRHADVPTSAAGEDLLKRIDTVVGDSPPAPSPQHGEQDETELDSMRAKAREIADLLDEIDGILDEQDSEGGKLLRFPGTQQSAPQEGREAA